MPLAASSPPVPPICFRGCWSVLPTTPGSAGPNPRGIRTVTEGRRPAGGSLPSGDALAVGRGSGWRADDLARRLGLIGPESCEGLLEPFREQVLRHDERRKEAQHVSVRA